MSTEKDYGVPVTARIDPEDAERLQQLADEGDRSRSSEVRRAIRFYLDHKEEAS